MIESLFKSRADKIFFYSPYNFIREIDSAILLDIEKTKIAAWESQKGEFTESFQSEDGTIIFYLKELSWDTDFFGIKTVKLSYCLFDCKFESLVNACSDLKINLKNKGFEYCFIEIPSEDSLLIQALTTTGYKLVETRLTYFNSNPATNKTDRFKVRKGTLEDIPNLRNVAAAMRNEYDRFHADPIFNTEIADEFLAKYIEEALKGYCDVVLVPNETGIPSDSFLTANYNKTDWQKTNWPVSKMVLSAVSSQTNKGWYKKLISEMTYHLVEEGAKTIFMNTQATNRAVFRTWENLGYKLGCTTHVLSSNL